MDSGEDGNSSDGSVAHRSDMSGGSGLEQELIIVPHLECPDFVCLNTQWIYLQNPSPCTSTSLGVSDMGEDSDDDGGNSNSHHSLTGQRFAQYENATVKPPTRVSEQPVPPSTGVADAEAPSVQQPIEACVAPGMVVDSARRALDGNAMNESSLPLAKRTNAPAEVTGVEGPPRALPPPEACAVDDPTLDGSSTAAFGVVCDEGNGKYEAAYGELKCRIPSSSWASPLPPLPPLLRSPLSDAYG